ncbi:MAG: metallophosphoesterase [Sphingomonadales bacterium]|nr:metallophosphoesterase [Sphingomonadales bacterium]
MHEKVNLPDGDVLVHAGDISGRGEYQHYRHLSLYMMRAARARGFKHIIVVPGNHDITFETEEENARDCFDDSIHVLINQEVVLEGVKFYGSPMTPRFFDWAFNVDRDKIHTYWDRIPNDTDVLITHGPPFNIRDRNSDNFACGCKALGKRVAEVSPKVHIFGHIHEGYGTQIVGPTTFVNASSCTGHYRPTNKAIVVDI